MKKIKTNSNMKPQLETNLRKNNQVKLVKQKKIFKYLANSRTTMRVNKKKRNCRKLKKINLLLKNKKNTRRKLQIEKCKIDKDWMKNKTKKIKRNLRKKKLQKKIQAVILQIMKKNKHHLNQKPKIKTNKSLKDCLKNKRKRI